MTVICNECNYPAPLVEPWRCPNPACRPGDAARRASRKAWEAARDRWVQERVDTYTSQRVWINRSAFEEQYERDRPWPAGAAFPVADPPWREQP